MEASLDSKTNVSEGLAIASAASSLEFTSESDDLASPLEVPLACILASAPRCAANASLFEKNSVRGRPGFSRDAPESSLQSARCPDSAGSTVHRDLASGCRLRRGMSACATDACDAAFLSSNLPCKERPREDCEINRERLRETLGCQAGFFGACGDALSPLCVLLREGQACRGRREGCGAATFSSCGRDEAEMQRAGKLLDGGCSKSEPENHTSSPEADACQTAMPHLSFSLCGPSLISASHVASSLGPHSCKDPQEASCLFEGQFPPKAAVCFSSDRTRPEFLASRAEGGSQAPRSQVAGGCSLACHVWSNSGVEARSAPSPCNPAQTLLASQAAATESSLQSASASNGLDGERVQLLAPQCMGGKEGTFPEVVRGHATECDSPTSGVASRPRASEESSEPDGTCFGVCCERKKGAECEVSADRERRLASAAEPEPADWDSEEEEELERERQIAANYKPLFIPVDEELGKKLNCSFVRGDLRIYPKKVTQFGEVHYSPRYEDERYVYRHVLLSSGVRKAAEEMTRLHSKTGFLSEEQFIYQLGIDLSPGWQHFMRFKGRLRELILRRPPTTEDEKRDGAPGPEDEISVDSDDSDYEEAYACAEPERSSPSEPAEALSAKRDPAVSLDSDQAKVGQESPSPDLTQAPSRARCNPAGEGRGRMACADGEGEERESEQARGSSVQQPREVASKPRNPPGLLHDSSLERSLQSARCVVSRANRAEASHAGEAAVDCLLNSQALEAPAPEASRSCSSLPVAAGRLAEEGGGRRAGKEEERPALFSHSSQVRRPSEARAAGRARPARKAEVSVQQQRLGPASHRRAESQGLRDARESLEGSTAEDSESSSSHRCNRVATTRTRALRPRHSRSEASVNPQSAAGAEKGLAAAGGSSASTRGRAGCGKKRVAGAPAGFEAHAKRRLQSGDRVAGGLPAL